MKKDDDNITITCKDCVKSIYPAKGKFKKSDMQFSSYVKKAFDREHMWIKIVSVHDDGIIGTVDNQPVLSSSPKLGEMVFVKYKKIEDVK